MGKDVSSFGRMGYSVNNMFYTIIGGAMNSVFARSERETIADALNERIRQFNYLMSRKIDRKEGDDYREHIERKSRYADGLGRLAAMKYLTLKGKAV
jgi:hypothetical protein